jgi:AraC family transcriptional regulator
MLQAVINSGYRPWPVQSVDCQSKALNPEIFSAREKITRPMSSDLAMLYPDAIVTSSDAFGWQHVRAIHLQHSLGELILPPSDNHCLMLNLGAPLHLKTHFGKRSFQGKVRAGEVAIIPAGLSWSCQSQSPRLQNTLLLYLRPLFVRSAVAEFNFSYKGIALTPQIGFKEMHIRHVAMSLLHELNEANVLGRLYADSLAIGLAMQFVRCYSSLKDVHIGRGGMAPSKLRRAIGLIDQHLAGEEEGRVELKVVARSIGMSYFHFSRAFKQSMGMSPTNYIAERRIERAKKLLEETELPIQRSLCDLGFPVRATLQPLSAGWPGLRQKLSERLSRHELNTGQFHSL